MVEIKSKSQVKGMLEIWFWILRIRRYNKFQKRCPSRRIIIDALDNCRVGRKGGLVTGGYKKFAMISFTLPLGFIKSIKITLMAGAGIQHENVDTSASG
jgi:hypothetical protein